MAEPLYNLFSMDIDTYLKVYELALEHGKKPGDSMSEEFEAIAKLNKEKITYLGTTNKDKDLLVGDLREDGLKVLNIDEIKPKDIK